MATAGMGVKGVDQLVDSLGAAATELAGLASSEAGELLAGRVRDTAPRDTGHMASTVGSTVTAGRVDVTVATDYAPIVNARTLWASRALDDMIDQILQATAADVAAIVGTIRGA